MLLSNLEMDGVVMVLTFNSSTQAEAGGSLEFEASLVYRASSRTARVIQRNSCLEKPERGRGAHTYKGESFLLL